MIDPPRKTQATRYVATLLVEGTTDDRDRRLRRAVKTLLRTFGIRLEAITPEAKR